MANEASNFGSKPQKGPGVLFREGVDSLTRGNAKSALQHFREILKKSRIDGDQNTIGWALLHMAMVLRGQREYQSVIQLLEQARAIFVEVDNKFGLGSVFHELSLANRERNRQALALEYAHQSVKLFREMGRTLELAWAYDNLAVIHFNLFHRHEILTYAKKARAIFLEFDSQIGLAWNACNLAGLYFEMGFYDRSERYYQEALKSFQRLESRQGMAWALLGLATVYRGQYKFKWAQDKLDQAESLYEELGLKDRLGWCLLNKAAICRALGDGEEAIKLNKKALQLFSPLRNHDGVGWSLFQLGQIYRKHGQLIKAWQTVREGLNLHSDISNKKGMGWAENEWGEIYLELNDQDHARERFVRAKVIADQLDEGPLKVEVEKNLARLNIEEGLLQKAQSGLDKSLETSRKYLSKEAEIEILLEKVRYWVTIGEIQKASGVLEEAERIQKENDLKEIQPALLVYRAEILAAQKDKKKAIQTLEEAIQEADRHKNRLFKAKALIGLIQLSREVGSPRVISSYFSQLNKENRALSSRRLRAEAILLKGFLAFNRKGSFDLRAFNQALNVFRSAGLFVLEKLTLDTLVRLAKKAKKEKDGEEYRDRLEELFEVAPADVRLARPRGEICPSLPISMIL